MSAASRSQPESVENQAALPPLVIMTPEETRKLLDEEAREYLGMTGEEFERRWRAGEYDGLPENQAAMRVSFLLPPDCWTRE